MAEKRYFWLKLKDDFFDEKYIKALRKLPRGDSLTVIYLKMQLKSLKTEGYIHYEGVLPDSITELSLFLDEEESLVRTAVENLIKFGAIERLDNEAFYMVALQSLIGSETQAAERVRRQRERNNVTNKRNNVTLEKEIEKEIDIELEKDIYNKPKTQKRFRPPTLEEVKAYCLERNNSINPEKFFNYYEANGWKVGRGKMKDWKAAVRSWESNGYNDNAGNKGSSSRKYCTENDKPTDFSKLYSEVLNNE